VIGKATPYRLFTLMTLIMIIAKIAKSAAIAKIENQRPLKHRGTEDAEA
jgi:hypothetical protein